MTQIKSIQSPIGGLSVVIPVYNSERILNDLVARLADLLPQIAESYEIILVNDDSKDQSWAVIESLLPQYPILRGICLMRNYGQHNAILCGIRQARYDIIVTMDDDLQHPPEEISLLKRLNEGWDVVYGTPEQEAHGFRRDLASRITKTSLQKAMGIDVAQDPSAFRVFRTWLRDSFSGYDSPNVYIDVLLTWGTTRFSAVRVRHDPRNIGVSNYNFKKLIIHALNMLTAYSVVPLQIATFVGFTFTLFGIGILFWVIGRFILQGGKYSGFPFLASIISIFSGVQLFSLGVIGEYLARMHFRTMSKPSYSIKPTNLAQIQKI